MPDVIACPSCGAKNRVDRTRATLMSPVCGRCRTPLPVQSGGGGGTEPDAGHPITVTDETFQEKVLGVSGTPVLVDFWAPWCGPCRAIAPTLEQLARESAGAYVIAKLNVDENPQTAQRYDITGIPAMLIFHDGREVDRIVGLAPKQAIAQKLTAVGAHG